jgi:hypothetical protein
VRRIAFIGKVARDKGGRNNFPKTDFVLEFAAALAARGIGLDIWDSDPPSTVLNLPPVANHLHLPPEISKCAAIGSAVRSCLPLPDRRSITSIVQSHEQLLAQDDDVDTLVDRAAGLCLERVLSRDPSAVICFNPYIPTHRLLRSLAHHRGVRWIAAERGIVPGSIVFDDMGIHAEGCVAKCSETFDTLPINSPQRAAMTEYFESLRVRRVGGKRDPVCRNSSSGPTCTRRPSVLFAGVDEWGCGMRPVGHPSSLAWSPVFRSNIDAFHALAKVANQYRAQVVCRPHPNDKFRHDHQNVLSAEGVPIGAIWDDSSPLFDAIERSRAVASIASTVLAYSLICNRPALLLGCNELNGRGVAYEVQRVEHLPDTLGRSLTDGLLDSMRSSWIDFASRYVAHYAFALDRELLAASGRGAETAACAVVCALTNSSGLHEWANV